MADLFFWRSKKAVDVICPHCGAHQSEPKDCISTVCKGCGGYFKPKSALRVEPHHKRPKNREKRSVECFSCHKQLEVSDQQLSAICHHCGYDIDMNDYSVEGICARNIETKGHLYVG